MKMSVGALRTWGCTYQKPVFQSTMDDESSCAFPFDQFQELRCDDDFCRVTLPWVLIGVFTTCVGIQRHARF